MNEQSSVLRMRIDCLLVEGHGYVQPQERHTILAYIHIYSSGKRLFRIRRNLGMLVPKEFVVDDVVLSKSFRFPPWTSSIVEQDCCEATLTS